MKKISFTIAAVILMVAATLRVSAWSEESRNVSGYNRIASGGPFNVHVRINGTESLKINAESDVIKEIETVVKDGTLQIKFRRHDWGNEHYGPIDIYVTAKSLSGLSNAGSGSIKVDGTLTGSDVNVSLSGSGDVQTAVKAGNFHASISGSGHVELNGSANEAKVDISGSGDLNGRGFKTGAATVSIAGSGNAHLGAEKTIAARIVGSGNVYYTGSATVTDSRTVGSGRLTKAD